MSVINPDETHEPDEFHEPDDPSRGTQSAAGGRRIPALANAGHHEPSIPAVDSTLLDSLDITPRSPRWCAWRTGP